MITLVFTLILLFGLGSKLAIPIARLLLLALLLVGLSLQAGFHMVFVLICLFIAAPVLSHWKAQPWTKISFMFCVLGPCLLNLWLIFVHTIPA
ncbi:hypothetical protein CAG54_02380 [Vibrio sp. V27_P1S3P104]|uniref:hypothetical protein n=1 Tax=unclassified Vibrio TaxID=2614977 RepID=UPI00137334EF|nr:MULTISPECIES: hypothetical protein [unclassified Vibrio]NAW69119.1 hypothetical protein [Vibrio sp. V28_P6S34P95]NAX06360.1 hypothetical protein [Vibrio sp. V30_P3S12P165]NAX35280.1 hypothetical protein [Vibrio sp. V29_P1S30P107]NAX36370.1 hypothetical protein [Vibrio sp. V27_P1S3P104]